MLAKRLVSENKIEKSRIVPKKHLFQKNKSRIYRAGPLRNLVFERKVVLINLTMPKYVNKKGPLQAFRKSS